MSAEELQQSDNKEKVTELFGNGTVVDSSPNDLELADKSDLKKSHDESAGSAAVARSSFTVDESPKIKSSHALCTYLKNTAILVWIERVFVISICIAVAIGFTVPIIIYAADTDRGSDNSTLSIDLNVDNCPSFDMQETVNGSARSLYNNQCVQYSGVCAQYLSHLNNQTTLTLLNGQSEDDINGFIDIIIRFASMQCRDAVLPFLCQYIFPPCDVNNGNVHFVSRTQCINIRDVVCFSEWNFVINTQSAALLPNCENFDDNDLDDVDNETSPIVPQSLQCQYQFKEFCGLCLPLCGRFSQYRVQAKFQERGVLIFSGITAFIGGILVFIVSVYRRNAMFDFPSVLVIYNTVCTFIIACFVLITYIGGQERLYCSHEALHIAFDNPTAFCQVAGIIFHWSLVFLTVLWLLHLIHLFIKVVFPIWSRKLDRKQTKIILHVTEVGVAFILCGLAPIIYVSVSEYSFGRFPPLFCFPSRVVSFYTVCIPLCVMLATGVILAIIMFWLLHKRQQLFTRKKSKYLRYFISFSVPEVKILILSCYFIIFGIMALINLSISIRDADIILDKLLNYFACQARGYSASNTCYEEYEELDFYLKPELNSATYFLLGLVPWSNLLFAIQVTDIKRAFYKIARLYSSRDSQERTYSTSNTK